MARKEKKYHYIYKTTNLKTGKFYVGMHSTDDLNDGYLGSGTRLRRSIRRNGNENFKLEILEFLSDRQSLANREKELVNEDLLKDEMCMNLKPGGSGGFVNELHAKKFHSAGGKIGGKLTGPTNGKIRGSKHKKRLEEDLEYRKKWLKSCDWNGRKHKLETIEKMREIRKEMGKGSSNSQYGTHWVTNGIENKKIKSYIQLPEGWYKGRK